MKKKILLVFLLAALCLTLCACATVKEMFTVVFSDPVAPAPEPTAALTAAPTPSPSPTQEPTPEPTATPRIPRSNTSGAVLEGDERYRPAIVSIENHPSARPQTGLMNADIVYEFLVEVNYTRFLALFSDDQPCLAGPVRSARYYFLDVVQEWNALYGFQGYVQLLGQYRRRLSDYPGVVDGHTKEFKRVNLGASKVHSLYVYLADMVENNYGDLAPERADRFHFDDQIAYEDAQRVKSLELPFTKQAVIKYEYDAANGLFARYQDDKVFEARMPVEGEKPKKYEIVPVTVKNLILQFCDHGKLSADDQPGPDKGRRSIELTGSGECAFFVNGAYLKGTWERPTLEDTTRYCLEDGQLVTLQPGNTWIEVLPTGSAWSLVYEGSTEQVFPGGSTEGTLDGGEPAPDLEKE